MNSSGDRVAIGAYENDGNGDNAGHVRVYDLVNGSWTQVGEDIDGEAAEDWSGDGVALSANGSTVAIGALGFTGNTNFHRGINQAAPCNWRDAISFDTQSSNRFNVDKIVHLSHGTSSDFNN